MPFAPKSGHKGSYFITRDGEIVGPGRTHAQVLHLTGATGTVGDALDEDHTRVDVRYPSHTQGSRFFYPIEVAITAPSMNKLEWAVYLVQRDLPEARIHYDIGLGRKVTKSGELKPGEELNYV